MKKFVAGLIILCLIIVAGVGYLGSRNGGVPQGAPVANSTAGNAGTDSGAAVPAPADGPEGLTGGGAGTGAAEEVSAPRVYLDYEKIYALHGADEKACRIGDREGTWGDYFYLLYTQSSQIEQYLATYAMYGMPVSWEDKVEEDGEYDCRKFGLAYTTVGSDTPGVNDFFEHTDLSDKAVQPGTDPDISSQAAAGSSLPASDTEKTVSDADSASLPVSSEETMQNDPPSPDAPSGGKNHTAEILLSTLGLV